MSKMPWLEVKQIAEEFSYLSAGQKVRTNHNSIDCAGGSNSMIVEKKDDDSISIHCFRCGNTGYYSRHPTVENLKARANGGVTTVGAGRYFEFPSDANPDVGSWPTEPRVWLRRGRITDAEALKYDISWSDSLGRVVIPVNVTRNGGTVTRVDSFQTRAVLAGDTKPKYLSYKNKIAVFVAGASTDSKTLVIVEDVLSCIRVARHLPCMALLGVKLQPTHIEYISSKGYNNFIVFLDDDNNQVKLAQVKIARTLELFGQVRVIHNDGVDPKEMSDSALRSILND